METAYSVIVTEDGKVTFTHDEEVLSMPTEILKEQLTKDFHMNYSEAEGYAAWLKNQCMYEYNREFPQRKRTYDKQEVEETIEDFTAMKPIIIEQCINNNKDGKGEQDARELDKDFSIAIWALKSVLSFLKKGFLI